MGKHLRIVSVCLLGASLLLPTHCTNVECSGFGSGAELFFGGWMGAFFYGGAAFAWFANPVYFIALRYVQKEPLVSIGFACVAIIIACTFLSGGSLLLNEAGNTAYVTKIQIGYWFWIASMVAIVASAIFEILDRKKLNEPTPCV